MNTTISEALATGLPVVATKHSGFPDQVIDGKNGYLANEAEPEDVARVILTYLEHPERWGAMSDAARAHALLYYDREALIDKQVAFYKKFSPGKKVAFVIGAFPAVSETFIINQVADLLDRGVNVRIFSFREGNTENVSDRYAEYAMGERVRVLEAPANVFVRMAKAIPKILRILLANPSALSRVFSTSAYGREAYSLKNLFWAEPFVGLDADIVHCHFGTIANKYLRIKDMLGLTQPMVTTFYGYDVSRAIKEKGPYYYDRLMKESAFFFTMSNNMKERILPLGFPPEKVEPLPVSVDVKGFPFVRRAAPPPGELIRIVSVGRFVEKKGFDDLLRAIALVKEKAPRPFILHIIGGGVLESELKALAKELNIEDTVRFEGYMKVQDVVKFLTTAHLFVQTSKTARDGDME